MKIYFAGSIRGGREDQELYLSIISELQKYGTVLTEHVGNKTLTNLGETELTNAEIFDRDMEWVKESDLVVAEVSAPSLGVGYELGQAQSFNKPILCLHREIEGRRLSAMVAGNKYFSLSVYKNLQDITTILNKYFESRGLNMINP